jgi:hypothetical protein
MGRITVRIKVENLVDALLAERGELPPERVRSIETDAMVDAGATLLCLPFKKIGLSVRFCGTGQVSIEALHCQQRTVRPQVA